MPWHEKTLGKKSTHSIILLGRTYWFGFHFVHAVIEAEDILIILFRKKTNAVKTKTSGEYLNLF